MVPGEERSHLHRRLSCCHIHSPVAAGRTGQSRRMVGSTLQVAAAGTSEDSAVVCADGNGSTRERDI